MEPGDSIEFPVDSIAYKSVTHYVSHLGRLLGREYHMRTARTRHVYIVTREA